MSGTWLDVDAPDTNWRGNSEDPIPLVFGRATVAGAVYRFITCRPLDGHARTDATFWHRGTKTFNKSGRTLPMNYWPGWKRGLLATRVPSIILPAWMAGAIITEALASQPLLLNWEIPASLELPVLLWWVGTASSSIAEYRLERSHLAPLRSAIYSLLKTRDGVKLEIGRELIRAHSPGPTGRVLLPPSHPMPDGDRENLLELIRARLGSEEIDGRFNMEGSTPYVELHVPSQPPSLVTWEEMLERFDSDSPYLGQASSSGVNWDLHMESPHLVIAGGSGSGKSELEAWAVAQLMRGGAGVIVLDPKYSSHLWLYQKPGVLYCSEPAMIHDTVLWLDEELRSRGRASQKENAEVPPRIVAMIEERNSLQTLLREYWAEIREPSMPRMSPALSALDRLASQGRSLGIHVILAAQETAQVAIGSRANFGAFAVAGRLPASKWKLAGAARKPAIGTRPGRFGYITGDSVTVFQAAYPDLKRHSARLLDFAYGGPVQPMNVQELMMNQHATHPFPRSEPGSSGLVSVSGFIVDLGVDGARTWFENQKRRYPGRFPDAVDTGSKGSLLYREEDLQAYWDAYRDTPTQEIS